MLKQAVTYLCKVCSNCTSILGNCCQRPCWRLLPCT